MSSRRLRRCAFLLTAVVALAAASSSSADHGAQSLVSIGPNGGNGAFHANFRGASSDGRRAFFVTRESLVTADGDTSLDVYERTGNMTVLVSEGQINGDGAFDAFYAGASADGTRVFFETSEKLHSDDGDTAQDVYQRSGGATTTLISEGQINGDGPAGAFFDGASGDGTRVFFETGEQLAGTDMDAFADIYQRQGTTTTHVSAGGNGAFNALFDGNSADGSRVFFSTREALMGGSDGDTKVDVYEFSGGATPTRVSQGQITGSGSGAFDAFYDGSSTDGSRVFFETDEKLTSDDGAGTNGDGMFDVYERASSTTTRVSQGQINGSGAFDVFFDGNSSDGTRVFFETDEKLTGDDGDAAFDIYQRASSTTTRVSQGQITGSGSGAFDVFFSGNSADGTRVFFETDEKLTSDDGDTNQQDIYERFGSTTTLISTGPAGGSGASFAVFDGASADGTRVFFDTEEKLTNDDGDTSQQDIYERFGTSTTLISVGPNGGNGPHAAFFPPGGVSRDGRRVFFETPESLVTADGDSFTDVYVAVANPYDRPQSASPLTIELVPFFRQTIGTTQCSARGGQPSTHGAPLSFESCNPPAYGPGTAARLGDQSVSSVSLTTVEGDPISPADEADLSFSLSAADVRAIAGGGDYNPNPSGPDVTLIEKLRISDTYNGPSLSDPATVIDFDFSVPASCAPSVGPEGSTCSVTTSADTLTPGTIRESKDSVFQVFRVRLADSGSNGIRGDSDDRNFAQQGLYIP